MQPIQLTSCPDDRSSATYLAALIDRQVRRHGPAIGQVSQSPGALSGLKGRPDGDALLWVEDAEPVIRPRSGNRRGVIVAAFDPGQGATERTLVVSYPVEAGSAAQRILAVLGILEHMGWSLLAFRRRRTADTSHANVAVLVSTARPGPEQRLWLAEPVAAPHGRRLVVPNDLAQPSGWPSTSVGVRRRRSQAHSDVGKGGAGRDAPA